MTLAATHLGGALMVSPTTYLAEMQAPSSTTTTEGVRQFPVSRSASGTTGWGGTSHDTGSLSGQVSASRLAELAHRLRTDASEEALVSSACAKLDVPLDRYLMSEGLGGSDLQLVARGIDATDDQMRAVAAELRQRMEQAWQDNERKLQKIEERQRELAESQQKSGCVKVLQTVATVVKAVASVSDCGATLGISKLIEGALSKAGTGGIQSGLGAAACLLGGPLLVGGEAVDASAAYLDHFERENHLAHATDLLADLQALTAKAAERDERNAEDVDRLLELVEDRRRAVTTLLRAEQQRSRGEKLSHRLAGGAGDEDHSVDTLG